jgi:glutaredoxin
MILRKVLTIHVPANRPGKALGRAVVLGVVFTTVLVLGLTCPATAEQKISEEGVCGPAPDTQPCPEGEQEPASILLSPPASLPFSTSPTVIGKPSPEPVDRLSPPDRKPLGPKGEIRAAPAPETIGTFVVHFFWGRGCPHCEEEKRFLDELKAKYPGMQVKDYEVWYDKANAETLSLMAKERNLKGVGVPVTFVGKEIFVGFTAQTRESLEGAI